MGVHHQTDLVADIARLSASIERAAAATEMSLTDHPSADRDPDLVVAEYEELRRQLGALRDREAGAVSLIQDPRELRAELATLLFFADTLQADAHAWRASLEARIEQLERQAAAERRERERVAAERERLLRRRDALQLTIDRTAARIGGPGGGDCRKTLPVYTLGEGVTVCSVVVSKYRRGFRLARCWLVTLNESWDDVLIRGDRYH
jgi:hypothetical protein